jgi:dTDP-4-amino-4,6-dideoxygalactose transaminase
VSIRLSDPRAGYLAHRSAIDAAIKRVLEDGEYILGLEVDAFEREFAEFIGTRCVISTASGTDALELSLRALGFGPSDFVITTSNTAVATVAAIELSGASPLLVEIDNQTLTMSPTALEQALRDHDQFPIKGVIPVHLYGQPADLERIMEICLRHNLVLIEDCAQAHGATVNGRSVGTWGILAAFSFYPTKNLGALGDGGAVATDDQSLADRLRELRSYGWQERYVSERPGMNSRLDAIQAAILRVKLNHLETENERRSQIAQRYDEAFADLDLILPGRLPNGRAVFHQYVVRSSARDLLREHLRQHGVETSVLYPVPIHQQPAYRNRIKIASELPITERAAEELLCLPVHPWLSNEEVERIIGALKSFFRH